MIKYFFLLFTLPLFICNCSKSEPEEIIEKWYEGKDSTLVKEIVWKDYDQSIKLKEIEYRKNLETVYLYEDSLLSTTIFIENHERKGDTSMVTRYFYDKFGNTDRIETRIDGEKKLIQYHSTLDKKTNRPTRVKLSVNGELKDNTTITEYLPNKVSTRTFTGDSLEYYSITYLNSKNQKTDISQYFKLDNPIYDSVHYEYVGSKIKREVSYINHKFSNEVIYHYRGERLSKVSRWDGKDSVHIKVVYSDN